MNHAVRSRANARLGSVLEKEDLSAADQQKLLSSTFPTATCIDGTSLSLESIKAFHLQKRQVRLSPSIDSDDFFNRSIHTLFKHLDAGAKIYGVNTLFGGLANEASIAPLDLQSELIGSHNAGSGNALCREDVRIAMLLRVNSLAKGASGIRREIVKRYIELLNLGVTPFVSEHGSIGASGDLIPLSSIAGACIGLNDEFQLFYENRYQPAPVVLKKIGLPRLELQPKEGLALINGTACLTAISANNCILMKRLFNRYMACQIAMCELLEADMRAFSEFVHRQRPHPGQLHIAEVLRDKLEDSALVRSQDDMENDFANHGLIQNRYSIRCIPQYTGAIIEDLWSIMKTVNIEMNSATDNPLIDADSDTFYHGGNFLGQHVAVAMDKMRVSIALMSKHNEAQIASLVEPMFSEGLPSSLVAPENNGRSVGIKPLQILSNSLSPVIERNAAPLTTFFPVHAEQFNQNLNSQGFESSQLTRKSIELFSQQLAATQLSICEAMLIKQQQKSQPIHALFSQSSQKLLEECLTQIDLPKTSTTLFSKQNSGKTRKWVELLATQNLETDSFNEPLSLTPSM